MSRGPDSPTDLPERSWKEILKRTAKEAKKDNLTDWAAALTFFAVLSIGPALVVLVSLLGLLGEHPKTTNALLDIVRQLGQQDAAKTLQGPIENLTKQGSGAGVALVIGLAGALWSASGYVGAFMRASNSIYEIKEGRGFLKLRPLQIAMTAVGLIVVAILGVSLVITGPVAQAIGNVIGLGDTAVLAWNIGKWPVMLALVMTMFAGLYYLAPNVKQPGFRWITPGGIAAVLAWVVASGAFALYVSYFGKYDKTYGSLAGVVVFLLWLWISNLALLFGAELDAELERERELRKGMPAEKEILLPPREPAKVSS
jgi:membrane protein